MSLMPARRRTAKLSPEVAELRRQLKAAVKRNDRLQKNVEALLRSMSDTNSLLQRLVANG